MAQGRRDDFSARTRKTLAERVGFCCSNPDCRRKTIGPNSDPIKSSSIGEAAHIRAAAPNGPRYDPSMTSKERASVENGIWLCSNCARLIDVDSNKYTIELLKQWKRQAEQNAEEEISSRDGNKVRNREKRKEASAKEKIGKNNRKSNQLRAKQLIVYITILAIILSILGTVFTHKKQSLNEKAHDYLALQESILIMNGITPEKAAISYNTGLESYREHQFRSAAEQFSQAIDEQERITGADSSEVGEIYAMLALSRIYSLNILEDNANDAVSAINRAIQIFQRKGNKLELARCYYIRGIAYFEADDSHLNRALQQVKMSIETLGDYFPENVTVLTVSYNDTELQLYFDYYDYESIYRACRYYELLQKNYDLLGKIKFKEGDISSALYDFNLALKTNSNLVDADYALATCDLSDRVEINNDEIKEYLQDKSNGSILQNTTRIKVYTTEKDKKNVDFGTYKNLLVYSSSDTATWLTNRAMSELVMGSTGIALEDCTSAIGIWDQTSNKSNISYSYIYLALSHLAIAAKAVDSSSYLEENKDVLQFYVDSAVTYDEDLWGPFHPRTAYSYETRGGVYYAIGETDIAIESYQNAIEIYDKLNDNHRIRFCQERIAEIESFTADN